MKTTLKERVRKKLLKFGRKNRICAFFAMPALVVVMFFFHAAAYLRGNSKRLVTMALIFCLFVVYSSFSFPMFITGNGASGSYHLDADSDVEFAPEAVIDLEEAELLAGEELLEEIDREQEAYMDTYSTYEVLAALEGYGRQNDEDGEPAEKENSGETVFSKDDWRLVLINKQHSIPDDYTFTLASFMEFKCDERILDDLADMFQAAKKDGINLEIRSPYRTHEHQVANFNRKIQIYMSRGMSYMEAFQVSSKVVTVPGNSEHEIGLALDITCAGFPDLIQSFGDTQAGKWLAENSCKYGFIVRYPKDKEFVTGIEYEPWHFRYVGREAATVIKEQGSTLEEFWESL